MSQIKRLRMFAGPNSSGKSTINDIVSPNYIGHYLNPDDIERQLRNDPVFKLTDYLAADLNESDVRSFLHPILILR